MFGLGIWEIAVVLVVGLLVLGPEKLPKVARKLGRGVRELRRAATDFQRSLNTEVAQMEEGVESATGAKEIKELAKAARDAKAEITRSKPFGESVPDQPAPVPAKEEPVGVDPVPEEIGRSPRGDDEA